MGFGTWLVAMVSPLVARVLISLGFAVVSVVGVTAVLTTLQQQFVSGMQAMPAAALQLVLLSGVGEAAGILFGAVATRVLLWQIQRGTKILGVGS